MDEQKKTQKIMDKVKNNMQFVLTVGAVGGLVVGIINFFTLTAVAPIEREVKASSDQSKANGLEIEKVKENYMPLDLSKEKWATNDKEHTAMNEKLDKIDGKIDRLLYK